MILLFALPSLINGQNSSYFCTEYEAHSDQCNVCLASYRTASGMCLPPSMIIPNCFMYSSPTSCAACLFGYRLVENHCLQLPIADPCLLYVRGACVMCKASVLLTPTGCQPSWGCSGLEHCDYCATNSLLHYCQKCAAGYTNVFNTATGTTMCVRSSGALRNCWTSMNGIDCFSCHVNYYLYRGVCYPSPAYHFHVNWMLESQLEPPTR